jgi:DNA/RNA endonuclease YhcR with UshA esterase domain
VVIWGEHRHLFGQPEKHLQGQKICVSGKIGEYRGVPQIVLRSPGQLEVVR